MSEWSFDVPGQPPSLNHLYVRVRGHWNKQAKAPGIEQYQQDVVLLCRAARPSGWKPLGQVRTTFEFYLGRDADCDNLIKVIHDAIALALDCNDRIFLPCVHSKIAGQRLPHTRITISQLPSPLPGPGT